MNITEVNVRSLINNKTKLKAVVSIVFDGTFTVHDILVIEGAKGPFVAMPTVRWRGGYRDVAHPLNRQTRERIDKAILDEYEKEKERAKDGEQNANDTD